MKLVRWLKSKIFLTGDNEVDRSQLLNISHTNIRKPFRNIKPKFQQSLLVLVPLVLLSVFNVWVAANSDIHHDYFTFTGLKERGSANIKRHIAADQEED